MDAARGSGGGVVARMSIDDSVLRDPRVTHLAHLTGWSRRETLGCLLEIWAVCYDRVDCALGAAVIDLIAAHPGFAKMMVEVELAAPMPSGKLRIAGAKERIKYLARKVASGREGGLKSAKLRANQVKHTSSTLPSTPQASVNPSVPDNPSASASVPDPVPDVAGAKAKRSRSRSTDRVGDPLPADWQPTTEHAEIAQERQVDLNLQARKFRAHAQANDRRQACWNGAFSKWLLDSRPEPRTAQTGMDAVLSIARGESP